MIRTLRVLTALAVCALATTAHADDPGEHEHPEADAPMETMASAHSGFADRADGHAPIGVMGEHMHPKGGWMLSYRYAHMRMAELRDGTTRLNTGQVTGWRRIGPIPGNMRAPYMVAPTDMDMDMHMFGAMVAPADWLTLGVMLPFAQKSMNHVRRDLVPFQTNSSDVGDVKVQGLGRIWENENHHVHGNLVLSLPTGSINETDVLPYPIAQKVRLPYPMQIGSGTWDLSPGATYVGHCDWLSWGAQALGTIRIGTNANGYRFGDRVDLTGWTAVPVTDWLSASFRVAWDWEGNIEGADPALNPALVPTADTAATGGRHLDLLGGINLAIPLGPLGTHRFAIEGGGTVHQNLNGPQLERQWKIVVGWQKAFGGH